LWNVIVIKMTLNSLSGRRTPTCSQKRISCFGHNFITIESWNHIEQRTCVWKRLLVRSGLKYREISREIGKVKASGGPFVVCTDLWETVRDVNEITNRSPVLITRTIARVLFCMCASVRTYVDFTCY